MTDASRAQFRWLRLLVTVVLFAGVLSCVTKGANGPADPSLAPVGASGRSPLAGFDEVRVTVRTPIGQVLSWCLLLAQTAAQRQRGLMTVTDPALGGYDGMLFRFDSDVTGGFWMRNTPMPLSIVFIDSSGRIVSSADMKPCGDSGDCPTYPAAGPYRSAIEVPQGGLGRLAIEAQSIVTDTRSGCS